MRIFVKLISLIWIGFYYYIILFYFAKILKWGTPHVPNASQKKKKNRRKLIFQLLANQTGAAVEYGLIRTRNILMGRIAMWKRNMRALEICWIRKKNQIGQVYGKKSHRIKFWVRTLLTVGRKFIIKRQTTILTTPRPINCKAQGDKIWVNSSKHQNRKFHRESLAGICQSTHKWNLLITEILQTVYQEWFYLLIAWIPQTSAATKTVSEK